MIFVYFCEPIKTKHIMFYRLRLVIFFYYIKVSGIASGNKLIKIGPQCVHVWDFIERVVASVLVRKQKYGLP